MARRLQRVPMRRLASLREVVAAVLFLASDGASGTTGATVTVDGGALVD